MAQRRIHVDTYSRSRHGKSNTGGPVSEHSKSVDVASIAAANKLAAIRAWKEDITDIQERLGRLQSHIYSLEDVATEEDAEKMENAYQSIQQAVDWLEDAKGEVKTSAYKAKEVKEEGVDEGHEPIGV